MSMTMMMKHSSSVGWMLWWWCCCSLLITAAHSRTIPNKARSKRAITVPCPEELVEPCELERNPGNARVHTVSAVYDLYACAAGGNAKDGHEVHVLSVFFAINNTIKLHVLPMDGAAVRKVRLVLMSYDPVTWNITTADVEISSIELISMNLTASSVSLNGAPAPTAFLHRKAAFWGFGRRADETSKLKEHVESRGYGALTSFSGAVLGSQWTLMTGNDHACKSMWTKNHDICAGREPGFHGEPRMDDCAIFVLCGAEHSYRMQCLAGKHWSRHSRQCEDDQEALLCEGEHPRAAAAKIHKASQDRCLISEKCWSTFPFDYERSQSPCAGGDQYIALTKYGLYVGVVLCNDTTYSILLSDSLSERFLPVGDSRGHGEDHCEFIGASSIHAYTHWTWSANLTEGYYRANWGESPKRGVIGMGSRVSEWTGRFYPRWYQCDNSIPGDRTVEPAALRIVEHSDAEITVLASTAVTLSCVTNYPEAAVTWFWTKASENEDWIRAVEEGAELSISPDGQTLSISDFSRARTGLYECRASQETMDDTRSVNVKLLQLTRDLGLSLSTNNAVGFSPGGVLNVQIGENLEVTCSTEAENIVTHEWSKDDKLLAVDSSTLRIPCFNDSSAGVYVCRVYQHDQATGAEYLDEKTFTMMTHGCGHEIPSSRIIGGKTANEGSAPWMVVLSESQVDKFCGGVLLNDRWVATAAHCLVMFESKFNRKLLVDNINVRLGYYKEDQDSETYQVKIVTKKVVHPDFNNMTLDADIALLRLEHPVELLGTVAPACLASKSFLQRKFIEPGGEGKVTGWGVTDVKQSIVPDTLQQLTMSLVDCPSGRTGDVLPTANMFCGGSQSFQDTCKGDSGSPYVMSSGGRWYLMGLVSWGPPSCGTGPSVFTKVPNYIQWIRQHISEDSLCEDQ